MMCRKNAHSFVLSRCLLWKIAFVDTVKRLTAMEKRPMWTKVTLRRKIVKFITSLPANGEFRNEAAGAEM